MRNFNKSKRREEQHGHLIVKPLFLFSYFHGQYMDDDCNQT